MSKTEYEVCKSYLKMLNFSHEELSDKYKDYQYPVWILSLNGRLVWFNNIFSIISKRDEKNLLVPLMYIIFKNNEHNENLVENLKDIFRRKEKQFSLMFDVNFEKLEKPMTVKISGKALESLSGEILSFLVEGEIIKDFNK